VTTILTPAQQRIEDALPEAAHTLYACAYADYLENEGYDQLAWSGKNLLTVVPRNPKAVDLVRPILAKIDAAWPKPVAEVFEAGGITKPEDVEHALSDLLLGCAGHGVSIFDDFTDALSRAEDALDVVFGHSSPIYHEDYEFQELAADEIASTGSPLPKR
jgi:hypothetical protein